ncbi:MAG TPA: HEAT repeat domain-containing protein [Planctomycetota bacterium]|nr:HEAT repeat domain-containing protein [Planctomycetota bacterium]
MKDVAEIVDRMPPLDPGGTFTGPSWSDMRSILEALLEGGRDSLVAVIGLLDAADDGKDYKARCVLHALAHDAGGPGRDAQRTLLADTLAGQLEGKHPPAVQGYLLRQLQVCGGPAQAPAIGRRLSDPDTFEYAAQALLAIGEGAAAEFRKALPALSGAPRRTAVQALGVLRDGQAVGLLREAAASDDASLRRLAAWSLANIGDPGAVELVLREADAPEGIERIEGAATALLLADRLKAAGKAAEAKRIYAHLASTRTEPHEAYLRDLASEE